MCDELNLLSSMKSPLKVRELKRNESQSFLFFAHKKDSSNKILIASTIFSSSDRKTRPPPLRKFNNFLCCQFILNWNELVNS